MAAFLAACTADGKEDIEEVLEDTTRVVQEYLLIHPLCLSIYKEDRFLPLSFLASRKSKARKLSRTHIIVSDSLTVNANFSPAYFQNRRFGY